jgi:cobalamin biosynthetic protein CobC
MAVPLMRVDEARENNIVSAWEERMNERAAAHGGDLDEARRRFPDAPEPWVDLSTGINPVAYPLPPLGPDIWARLPQRSDLNGLEAVAARAYGAAFGTELVAAPGTQALIQWLPRLVSAKRVGILRTTYEEHAATWRASGAMVESVEDPGALAEFEVAVLVNPNNPDGRLIAPADLRPLAKHFAASGGLLVIDEAFMDVTPDQGFAPHIPARGTVILRSFGKIFGLAGLRLGFAIAGPELARTLRQALGPWRVSGPAILIGTQALDDTHWLIRAAERLSRDAGRLDDMLAQAGFRVGCGGTLLFRLAVHPDAAGWFERLGRAGILVRRFDQRPDQLRFGLPGSDEAWQRLSAALVGAETKRT